MAHGYMTVGTQQSCDCCVWGGAQLGLAAGHRATWRYVLETRKVRKSRPFGDFELCAPRGLGCFGALLGTLTKLEHASRASLPHPRCRCFVLLPLLPSWLPSVFTPDLCISLLYQFLWRSRSGRLIPLFILLTLTQFPITSLQVAALALLVGSL